MLSQFENFLFNLLILKALSSKDGHIWRWIPSQFLVIEVTCKHLTYENSVNLAVSYHETNYY